MKIAEILYNIKTGKKLNFSNPQDINEKINWLKFNTDTSEWTRLSDKYLARVWIAERLGSEEFLPKLYGVWDNAEEIDFGVLPEKFVLKSNHASGTIELVRNKGFIDEEKLRRKAAGWLKMTFGKKTAEMHYFGIQPKIIAEEFLEDANTQSSSMIDYKFFCCDGKPDCVLVCTDRKIGCGCALSIYDLEWNKRQDILAAHHHLDAPYLVPKPVTFDKMKDAATILSAGFPQVRVDFYEVNGRMYVGEMTFTSQGGYMDYISEPYRLEMGRRITLPTR